MDATTLMRLHVRALFTQDQQGRLVTVNDPGRAPAPRFFLGRTAGENLCWIRHDVGASIAAQLQALCDAQPVDAEPEAEPALTGAIIDCLSLERPVERVWCGPAYEFPPGRYADEAAVRITQANANLLTPFLEEWREDAAAGVPMAASLHEGAAVSVCCSVRVTDKAHEAGVETHPDFRGRGHASRAVMAWATAVRQLGCVPLYSTSWENLRSRALATRLGLIQFGADLHIT